MGEWIFVGISAVVATCDDLSPATITQPIGTSSSAYAFLPVLLPVSYIFHLVSYLSAPCVIIYYNTITIQNHWSIVRFCECA